MLDRSSLSIMSVLMIAIVALLGIHLSSVPAEAQMEGMDMGDYRLTFTTDPAEVQAGEPFSLTLNFFQSDGTTPVTEFDEVHTKLLHLILVSDDLTQFLHLHPDYEGDGKFVLKDALLPELANYVVFADFTPTGDVQQVIRAELPVQGAEAKTPELAVSAHEVTVGALKVTLDIPETLSAGAETTITFHVSDAATGEPVDTLDEYLGAAGHLVMIDNTANVYIHTHPAGDHDMAGMGGMAGMTMQYGPDIQFNAAFPDIGLYALWLQIQYQGEVYTAPFVVDVTEIAESTPEVTHEAHHG